MSRGADERPIFQRFVAGLRSRRGPAEVQQVQRTLLATGACSGKDGWSVGPLDYSRGAGPTNHPGTIHNFYSLRADFFYLLRPCYTGHVTIFPGPGSAPRARAGGVVHTPFPDILHIWIYNPF